MKPHHFLSFAATGALSCCGDMHDPIYYNGGNAEVTPASPQAAPTMAQTNVTSPEHANLPPAPQKAKGLRRTGPFMQPDVFGMPKNDDLKETSTSTPNNTGNTGLTVPSQ